MDHPVCDRIVTGETRPIRFQHYEYIACFFFLFQKGDLLTEFTEPIDEGLIEVVKAPSNFYPKHNLDTIPRLYVDVLSKSVSSRSKQCLDHSFLYYYCADIAEYFVHLADDVDTRVDYFTKIQVSSERVIFHFLFLF